MADTVLMIGTRKGLWLAKSDEARRSWELDGPHFNMEEVYSCLVDTRGEVPRLYAGTSSPWTGPQLGYSDDLGSTWRIADDAIRFPEDTEASVERIWQLAAGAEPDVLWAGTEPGAVWRSDDRGSSFTLERALWDHPHRTEWGEGFGGQAFHTLLPHPTDPTSLTAAISSGGVYQTVDGGGSWTARNKGVRAEFLPEGEQFPEFGQCVHKMARHPARPERIFMQNHGGVYRSDDEGGSWTSIAEGLPADFGFPIAVHPHRPETIYVFPLSGSEGRHPTGGRAAVWRSDDAGESWRELRVGLPDNFYVGVMRDAMCIDEHQVPGVYVGARNGTVWGSADEGETWSQVAANLPDVMVVRAAAL
ncbi:WD40/YVTN/BNR-like repeat-containing protein [Nocardioides limicola]|uniref:WD40/YVTN/BNR-like repeat-containing protein n=1 Tax=Nocardioides limicola TaxID=2803368 RepID=UPI00193C5051|nr:exo-alpha-sialidase [Nocardioides sp. DJM-14]